MKVGIKYCGGCNPKYEREETLNNLIKRHKDWIIQDETAKDNDICLVICGCERACANKEGIVAKKIITLSSPLDFENI